MAFGSVLAVRKAIPFELTNGQGSYLVNPTGAWSFIGVDYANRGNEREPPSLSDVNILTDTETGIVGDDKIAALLPLSNEGVPIVSAGARQNIQFRRMLATRGNVA